MRMQEVGDKRVSVNTPATIVLEIEGRYIEIDEEGYLVAMADWSRTVAQHMADIDGVDLGDDHWLLIDFLHRFYREFEMAPELPVLARNLCKDQNDCRWTLRYIKQLFPYGAKTACRYAGLPAPVGRSCG